MSDIEFTVAGRPAPQGSKRHVGGGRMLEMSKYVHDWRAAVRAAAHQAAQEARWQPIDAPVVLRVAFYLARPKKPRFWVPAVAPDLSKLVRATEDALTGVIWKDDSRVVSTISSKRFAVTREPGALIRVTTINPIAEEAAA